MAASFRKSTLSRSVSAVVDDDDHGTMSKKARHAQSAVMVVDGEDEQQDAVPAVVAASVAPSNIVFDEAIIESNIEKLTLMASFEMASSALLAMSPKKRMRTIAMGLGSSFSGDYDTVKWVGNLLSQRPACQLNVTCYVVEVNEKGSLTGASGFLQAQIVLRRNTFWDGFSTSLQSLFGVTSRTGNNMWDMRCGWFYKFAPGERMPDGFTLMPLQVIIGGPHEIVREAVGPARHGEETDE